MAMPGRTYAAPGSLDDKYRYSHNGQEKDNDIFIGALSAEYWEYDSRTGRRWENDPIVKPWESPYACFANNPIWYNDIKGLDAKKNGDKKDKKSDKGKDKKKSKDNATQKGKDDAKDKGGPKGTGTENDPIYDKGDITSYNQDLNEVPVYSDGSSDVPDDNTSRQDNTTVAEPNAVDITKPKSAYVRELTTMEIVANNLRRFDHWVDHSHDEVSSKPIKTSFWGFQQTGDGGNKNVYFYGYPSHNDYSYTPSSNLGLDMNPKSFELGDLGGDVNFTITYLTNIAKNSGNASVIVKTIYDTIKNRFDKSSIKVSNDSNIMWHIEYSKDSVHEYRVDTKQAAGEKGVDDYNKKKYGSVVNKIQTK